MAEFELILPKMGESVAEATIIKWLKNEGDKIETDEAVLEIATDKVDSEVPSPSEGVLIKKLFKEGEVVKVGAPLALIGKDGAAPKAANTADKPKEAAITASTAEKKAEPSIKNIPNIEMVGNGNIPKTSASGKFYSPLVRNIAKAEGISIEELEHIPGTGMEGRVTKNDILSYIPNRNKTKVQPSTVSAPAISAASTHAAPVQIQSPAVVAGESDEIIEMDRMRKLIAEHMVMSKHVSPHVTSFVEADVTNMVIWRDKIKKDFEKREGEKITFTPIFIEAVTKAIKDFPMINVSLNGTNIILRKNINIGMAAALPTGNLIVPVIKNADRMNLLGLTKAVNDLSNRARGNKLKPDDIQGGTFTISNVGSFGNLMGTPIINQPQVAILAVGAIKKKPAVIETPQGDAIAIRHMMFLSLSYDHRIVDGALGGSFLKKVADILEKFDINRPL